MNDSSPVYLNDLLLSLSRALDFVEKEVFGVYENHGKRIALTSMRLCKTLGYNDEDVLDMASCAILHDNALTIDAIAARKMNDSRPETFPAHCTLGEEQAKDFPFLHNPQGIILHHHENWNGTGFFSLRDKEISPRGAVLRLTDELDLLFAKKFDFTQNGLTAIKTYVQKNTNTFYAPIVAEAFLDICTFEFLEDLRRDELDKNIKQHMPNISKPLSLDELLTVCKIFSSVTDVKSIFTASHCKGVAHIVELLANYLNLDPIHTKKIIIAAHLHDIGKLTVRADILEKPAQLTDDEYCVMKGHVSLTTELLSEIKGLSEIAAWAASHHEKLNGKGYPLGLTADELPFESRLIACADIYQALTEDRPYRSGMSHTKTMEILSDMASKNEIDSDLVRSMHDALDPQRLQEKRS